MKSKNFGILLNHIALLNGNHYQPLYPNTKDICMSTHYMLNRASDDNIRNISDKITGLLIEFLETMPGNQFLTERIKTIKINQEKELLSHLVISKSNILGANRL